jgi:hypothetical protein
MNKVKSFLIGLIYRVSDSELATRAFHTFLQAFLAALLVTGLNLNKTVLLAAVAAGISAAKTSVLQYLEERR